MANEPVAPIPGRSLADSWWGKAWNRNLEDYSDYSNRLPRGRTYVRGGAVVDLKISEGLVTAKVRGSRSRPYDVKIHISPIKPEKKARIIEGCGGKVSNIDALIKGNFPQEVGNMFLSQNGLFPNPSEIRFSCSCPDWAYMCKHVAATLYGIGRRFDNDPTTFFMLRGIDLEPLVKQSIEAKLESMLAKADNPSPRIVSSDRMMELFGMDLDGSGEITEIPRRTVEATVSTEPDIDEVELFNDGLSATVAAFAIHPDDPEAFVDRILSDLRFRHGLTLESREVETASRIVHSIALGIDEGLCRNLRTANHHTKRAGDFLVARILECERNGCPGKSFDGPEKRV